MQSSRNLKDITASAIIEAVGEYYGVSVMDIKSQKRYPKETVLSRQVAMYLIRDILSQPFSDIGAQFGGRHHTTVLHSLKVIEDELKTNALLRRAVDDLLRIITETRT